MLAFDTIYAERQRRYVESLSSYARQFLVLMEKPDLDSIDGLSPAISIDQKTSSRNPRSTVGTVTETYDYLRLGEFDVLVGVNLLREGLDMPEVSLVGILDADKEGFLRGETALLQTAGRAARHINGKAVMYADKMTNSIQRTIEEADRRRDIQAAYNVEHGITPASIKKGISDMSQFMAMESRLPRGRRDGKKAEREKRTPQQLARAVAEVEQQMLAAAEQLQFEHAAKLRDQLRDLHHQLDRLEG